MQSHTTKERNHSNASTRCLYGDLFFLLQHVVIVPTLLRWYLDIDPHDTKRSPALVVLAFTFLQAILLLLLVWSKNIWCSRMAALVTMSTFAWGNLVEWPHEGECLITTMAQGSVLIGVGANLSLSFGEKLIRLAVIFMIASYVSIQSPHSIYVEDTLPILGGTTLIAVFFLCVYHFNVARGLATVQRVQLIVATLYLYPFTTSLSSIDLSQITSLEQIINILKAAIITCICMVAMSTSQLEILQKVQLESLVRKRTNEIELQNQKLHMLDMALKATDTAIAIVDEKGCIVWANTALSTRCQKKEDALIGLSLKDEVIRLDTANGETNQSILVDSYTNFTKGREQELKIGESIFRLEATRFANTTKVRSSEKETTAKDDRFLMVFKDITAYHARDVAEQKAKDEAMMKRAMEESLVTLTHELRTPLQGIMGDTSLIMQQTIGEKLNTNEMMDSLKLIMASASLLLNLINNLLDVKKASGLVGDLQISPILVFDPIKISLSFCQPFAYINQVEIVTDWKVSKDVFVRSNALRLQQVLSNLLLNAIKYTRRGSTIYLRIETSTLGAIQKSIDNSIACSGINNDNDEKNDSSILVFSVSDCGSGIAPDKVKQLFRRCRCLESDNTNYNSNAVAEYNKDRIPSGIGLGLHLCLLLIQSMKGQIWASKRDNCAGACFSFCLPLVISNNAATVKRRCSFLSTIDLPDNNNKKKNKNTFCKEVKEDEASSVFDGSILFVDDILINRKVIGRMLSKIGVSNVVTVESGKEALEELSRHPFDLVITDLQMPEMSGTELTVAINNRISPPIVVGLTADTSFGVAERCKASGMADVLYKPVILSEMSDYLRETFPLLKQGVWLADIFDGKS